MANKIDLITKYIPLLDEVYKVSAKTAILDAAPTMVQQTNEANVVKVAKVNLDGLGDYSKNDGYPTGAITLDWETWTFKNDRGRRFNLDRMDSVESAGMAFMGVSGQFLRTQVVPEKDAYTIAAIASHEGVTTQSEDLDATKTKQALEKALAQLGENEVDEANMVIFCTPTVKGYLEAQLTRTLPSGETSYGQKINYFNDIPLVTIPQTRFYTAIDLLDGKTSGEEKGGYQKHVKGTDPDKAGENLNFIVMDRNAAMTIQKNAVIQVITPEMNQLHDGWTFSYRFYYDTFVYDNRANGILISKANEQV